MRRRTKLISVFLVTAVVLVSLAYLVVPQPSTMRHCTTLDGKTFEWYSANVPFGVLSCS
jgi:hypothetical protein